MVVGGGRDEDEDGMGMEMAMGMEMVLLSENIAVREHGVPNECVLYGLELW